MTSAEPTRDEAMEGRVARTLEHAGLGPVDVARVVAAHRLAMAARRDRLVDAHHPDFLHPGRVALILLLDTRFRDPDGLAAACLVDSEHPELRAPADRVRAELGQDVADLARAVPLQDEGLAEALVTAPHDVRMIALAERLDQCRHARFWADRAAQRRIHRQAEDVLGPVAERTDEALARRFAHWTQAFARTLARSG